MLARVPDRVQIRALLRQQPPRGACGIPVACEVDIYGALSEYIGVCVSGAPTTLLDINNTVPASMYDKSAISGRVRCAPARDLHGLPLRQHQLCELLKDPHMGYQLIMKRDLEPELPEPDITRGTMEGNIKARRHHVLPSAVHRGHTS